MCEMAGRLASAVLRAGALAGLEDGPTDLRVPSREREREKNKDYIHSALLLVAAVVGMMASHACVSVRHVLLVVETAWWKNG